MTMHSQRAVLTAAVLAIASAAGAQPPFVQHNGDVPGGTFFPEMQSHRVEAALPTADYLLVATRNAEFEKEAAEIAQERANSPRVRSFAARMATDSVHSIVLLQTAAQAAGVEASSTPAPNATEKAALDRLRGADGAAFDRLYLTLQMQEQIAMVGLHTNYRYNGSSRPLRTAAAREIPITEQHLSLLNSMRGLT